MAQIGDQIQLNFDFDGVVENGELVLKEGDFVSVTNTNVGEGWFEGRAANGQVGLFPMSYGEVVQNSSVNVAADYQQDYSAGNQDSSYHQEQVDDGGDDDDWDDWQNTNTQQPQPAAVAVPVASSESYVERKPSTVSEQTTYDESGSGSSPKKGAKGGGGGGLFGKGLFSSFTSSPGSTFVSGECKADVSSVPKLTIDMSDDGPYWVNTEQPFQCTISNPTKESKFSGLKSYIAYNITSANTDKTVSRRYKHFDWLYEQLTRKFSCMVAIPTLPDKQITGRYEDEFIETRRRQLENWINRMSCHPVVLSCDVFQHFLNSKDNEKAWKTGKRKAEHDVAVGAALYITLDPPMQRLDINTEEKRVESYGRFTKNFGEAVKQTIHLGAEHVRNCTGAFMKDNQKLGQQFLMMAASFSMDERPVSNPLTDAMKQAGTFK